MILVTGGTGHLGRDLVPALIRRFGRDCVRLLAKEIGTIPDVQWARGDLATGAGIREAMGGVDAVVHAATLSPIAKRGRVHLKDMVSTPSSVDVDGTRRLIEAAKDARVSKFLFASIVGLEGSSLPYSRTKLAGEHLVRSSNLAWSVVRATPFFYLMRSMLEGMLRWPLCLLPSTQFNPVDTSDVADYIVECLADGGQGMRDEIGGPETLPFSEFGRQLRDYLGHKNAIVPIPLPERMARNFGFARSSNGKIGNTRWQDWLEQAQPLLDGSPPATASFQVRQ